MKKTREKKNKPTIFTLVALHTFLPIRHECLRQPSQLRILLRFGTFFFEQTEEAQRTEKTHGNESTCSSVTRKEVFGQVRRRHKKYKQVEKQRKLILSKYKKPGKRARYNLFVALQCAHAIHASWTPKRQTAKQKKRKTSSKGPKSFKTHP